MSSQQDSSQAPTPAITADVVPPGDALAQQIDQIQGQMLQLLQNAIGCAMMQDTVTGFSIEDNANNLYNLARGIMGPDDLLAMEILSKLIAVYVRLPRATQYQLQARLEECKAECAKCRDDCKQALDAIARTAGDMEQDMASVRITFQFLSAMMTAIEASAEADGVLLEAASDRYLAALNAAIAASQAAAQVASGTADPNLQAMRRMATELADRMTLRVQFVRSSAAQGLRYFEAKGRKVFIVHGHAEARRLELKGLLQEKFKLEPVILLNEASGGRTLIEKFEDIGDECGYAFVLLTADDTVTKGKKRYLQARPNALFELGWFFGRLGPHRVCILKEKGTEVPSDLGGVLTLEFQDSIASIYLQIESELTAAGMLGQDKSRSTTA